MIDTPHDSPALVTSNPKPTGRPPIWHAGQLTKAFKMLTKGNSVKVSCHSHGIPEASFHAWLKRGKADAEAWLAVGDLDAPKSDHHKFLERYRKAMGDRESKLVGIVHESATAKDDPNVADAKWLLARFNPKRWGDKATLSLQGETPIARDELMETVKAMATVVQEEVMAMTCTEAERHGALLRIESQWKALFASLRPQNPKPIPSPSQAVSVDPSGISG